MVRAREGEAGERLSSDSRDRGGAADRARNLSLAEMFRMELVIGTHCAQSRFRGGAARCSSTRTAPGLDREQLDALSRETVLGHFESPWEENPLADLQD